MLPLVALAVYFYKKAMALRSFYILLMLTMYAYIGISYVLIRLLTMGDLIEVYYLILLYFIASAVYVSLFLIRTNKKIKANDSL
jgi:hypothetical protein